MAAPAAVEYRTRVPRLSTDDANPGSDDGWVTATTSFSIAPYFHETRAFWLLCAAIALLLVFAVVRWRTRQLRWRAANLQAAVDEALAQIKVLGGLLPICAGCKKVRGDEGYWQQIESYLHTHSEAELSHGLCPDCASELYGAYLDVEASDESERSLEAEAS